MIINEELLLEGKNLQQTFDRYKDKLRKSFDPFEVTDDELWKYMESILSADPTYQPGGTTTGDYGIWLLNQEVKDNITPFEARTSVSIEQVLNDFIDKKANLANKDINSYKTIEELWNILKETPLSDRQKERKLRKNISGAKHIASTKNFDIYIPETYEASCALGKGSGWCTADSRTRQYYDYYKDKYGGDYYIIISKDGKWKYQIHFQSQQYSAAGTNPDINSPNEEEMLQLSDITDRWPELSEFINSTMLNADPETVLDELLSSYIDGSISISLTKSQIEEITRGKYTNTINSWLIDDFRKIPSIRVQKAIFDNQDVAKPWMGMVNKRDPDHLLDAGELQDLSFEAFQYKLPRRLQSLKLKINERRIMSVLRFPMFADQNKMVIHVTRMKIIQAILDQDEVAFAIQEYIKDGDMESLKDLVINNVLELESENFNKKVALLLRNKIMSDIEELPMMYDFYFTDDTTTTIFFDEFDDLLFDAVFDKQFMNKNTEDKT